MFEPPPTGFDDALARYNADGSLDPNFGTDGKVTTEFGAFAEAAGLAIQANGKLVAAGSVISAAGADFALARYDAAGDLDPGFGTLGKLTTDFAAAPISGREWHSKGTEDRRRRSRRCGRLGGLRARPLPGRRTRHDGLARRQTRERHPFNVGSNGLIPVAIITTNAFDATTVDASSVCFGDAEEPAQRDCTEAHGTGHIEDVNGDGRPDLLLHYETGQTGIDPGDTTACLTGTTVASQKIEGGDSISTV